MSSAWRCVYADENIDQRAVSALRARGFTIETALDAGLLGADDETQLLHAATNGCILLTCDRRDFRRLHARFLDERRAHAGIALLPQRGPLERLIARAVLVLTWLHTEPDDPPRLLNWSDVQLRLHRGEGPPGISEQDVRVALGQTSRAT